MSRDGEDGQNTEDVQRRVDELGWWYHHFELPSGVWTGTGEPPAYDPVERWELFEPHLPDDLQGKSVLDVGGNSGYFSLRMKQRGAGRCVMVEPIVEFVDQATFVFEQFGVEVDVVCEDVHAYCLTTDERFDYALFLGLFYHLKYPVLVLDRLAEMTKELIFFNSHIEGIPPEAPAVEETAPSALGRMRRSVAKRLGPSQSSTDYRTYALPTLLPGTTYYWKIVSKTMAYVSDEGPVWSFRTAGTAPNNVPPSVTTTTRGPRPRQASAEVSIGRSG